MTERPVICWKVFCFDRREEKPPPFIIKTLSLDWNQVSDEDAICILSILQEQTTKKTKTPDDTYTRTVTLSYCIQCPDWRMLRYRHFFKEVDSTELHREWTASSLEYPLLNVNLNADYYEDEEGKQITEYEIKQCVSGVDQPIIPGDTECILCLGAVRPKDPKTWKQTDSDTIAHFLEIVTRIYASNWYLSPHTITYHVRKSDNKQLVQLLIPYDQSTMGVLAYLRQLHAANDKLLEKACNAYIIQCSDGRKRAWVNERMNAFTKVIDSPPFLISKHRHTSRKIMRMFFYGAGLLHSTSNSNEEFKLAAFVDEHGRQKAVTIFNSCLMDIFCIALQAFQVIKQDYDYWIKDCELMKHGRLPISELFQSVSTKDR